MVGYYDLGRGQKRKANGAIKKKELAAPTDITVHLPRKNYTKGPSVRSPQAAPGCYVRHGSKFIGGI